MFTCHKKRHLSLSECRPPLLGVFNELQSRVRDISPVTGSKLDLDLDNDMDDVMSCSDDMQTDCSQNGGDLDGQRKLKSSVSLRKFVLQKFSVKYID